MPGPDKVLARLRAIRWRAVAVVALIHAVLLVALVRAFTPQIADTVLRSVTRAITVTITPDPPEPAQEPAVEEEPDPAPEREEGLAGAPGKEAQPREVSVPEAPVVIRPTQAPPASGTGKENDAGATEEGEGTGAQGVGRGTGAGDSGRGQGGGGRGSPTVKIAGDINSARDYPRKSRKVRIGASVIIDVVVGIDGSPQSCRIVTASPDPEADRITCELAMSRFRFRPARNGAGEPIEAIYRWRQRWFY